MSDMHRRDMQEDSSSVLRMGRRDGRSGTALCLSGGGFRAALFHLGALRRLNELGILSSVNTISAVSGGSILAAHLVERIPEWPHSGEALPDWDGQVAEPFRAITSRNFRTGPVLRRFLPWNWTRPESGIDALDYRPRAPERLVAVRSQAEHLLVAEALDRLGDLGVDLHRPGRRQRYLLKRHRLEP